MSQDIKQIMKGQDQLIKGQQNMVVTSNVREENAEGRHEVAEENADQRHNDNCYQHGSTRRVLWGVVGSLLAVIGAGAAYHFYALDKSDMRNYSLRKQLGEKEDKLETVTQERDKVTRAYVNLQRSQKQVTIDKTVAEKEIESLNEHILNMYKTSENEAKKNAEYYAHKDERIEGLTDHVMFLNDQGEQQEQKTDDALKLAERYRKQRDTKNQFMAISKAITEDNPARLMEVLDGEDFTRMIFYKQAVQCAIGLQSFNILNHIQTLDGWDKTIPQELVSRVISPQMVPLADFQKLKAGYDQQAGRLADLNKKNSRKEKKRMVIKNEKFEADHNTSVAGGQEEAENETPLLR